LKNRLTRYLKILVFLLLGLLILYLITRGQNMELILLEFKHANYFWVVLVMIISLISHLIRAIRWNLLVNAIGFHPTLKQTFIAVMAGYLSNLAVPRMGEITKCAALGKTAKIPLNMLVGTVVSERVVDFFTLLFIVILTISLQVKFLQNFLNQYFIQPLYRLGSQNLWLLIISGLVILLVITFTIFYFHKKFKLPPRDGFFFKLKHQLIGFAAGVKTLWKMKNKFSFIFQTFLIWILYFLTVYLSFFAIRGTAHLGPMAGFTLLAVGSIGVLAPMPGGIGTYHLITILTLTELYGVAAEPATSYAYIAHAAQMLVIILAGSAAWFFLSFINPRANSAKKNIQNYQVTQVKE
jgi:glycosyltransferase 2 family protein